MTLCTAPLIDRLATYSGWAYIAPSSAQPQILPNAPLVPTRVGVSAYSCAFRPVRAASVWRGEMPLSPGAAAVAAPDCDETSALVATIVWVPTTLPGV